MTSETAPSKYAVGGMAQRSAIVFALVYPTVLTLAYFVLLSGFSAGLQQAVYSVGKFVQFGFPVFWVVFVLRERIYGNQEFRSRLEPDEAVSGAVSGELVSRGDRRGRGVIVGLVFGLIVAGAMIALFMLWIKTTSLLQPLEVSVREKTSDLGLTSFWKYAAVGVFYSLVHSFLEEYYWRWFVFRQLQKRIGVHAAVTISSVGFMAHHVILLATYFGWTSPLSYLLSLCVGLGGLVWAYIYFFGRSLIGPWLSHMLVDAAIFLIGYDLIRYQIG